MQISDLELAPQPDIGKTFSLRTSYRISYCASHQYWYGSTVPKNQFILEMEREYFSLMCWGNFRFSCRPQRFETFSEGRCPNRWNLPPSLAYFPCINSLVSYSRWSLAWVDVNAWTSMHGRTGVFPERPTVKISSGLITMLHMCCPCGVSMTQRISGATNEQIHVTSSVTPLNWLFQALKVLEVGDPFTASQCQPGWISIRHVLHQPRLLRRESWAQGGDELRAWRAPNGHLG